MPNTDDADFVTYAAKYARHRALADEILPRNKSVLVDALAGVRINTVVVRFDGCGDSGQIEEIAAFDANTNPVELPAVDIVVEVAQFEQDARNAETTSLRPYVETLTYELLENTHSGWGNDDGAYGDLTIDVPGRAIKLEYNERYTASTYSEHDF